MRNILSVMATQIKSYRKKRGYTQVRLSSESGVELRHLQRIEAGSVDIRLGTVERIADTLKISASQLFHDSVGQVEIEDISQIGPYQLLDGLAFGISVFDREGLIRYCNRPWCSMINYENQDVINKMYIWETTEDEESAEGLKKYLKYLLENHPQPKEFICPHRAKSGETVWVHVRWNYILNKNNEVLGFVSAVWEVEEPQEDQPLKVRFKNNTLM